MLWIKWNKTTLYVLRGLGSITANVQVFMSGVELAAHLLIEKQNFSNMQKDNLKNENPTDANNVLADRPLVNPYKGMRCNYFYDYCNPESCNCKKSSEWERKHNPYHDWVNYSVVKPPIGVEVIAQTDE